MYRLKNYRKIEKSGRIWEAYFETVNDPSKGLEPVLVEKKYPFGGQPWGNSYQESVDTFICGEKRYAVLGFDHFNAHISGYRDRSAIFSIKIAEVYKA